MRKVLTVAALILLAAIILLLMVPAPSNSPKKTQAAVNTTNEAEAAVSSRPSNPGAATELVLSNSFAALATTSFVPSLHTSSAAPHYAAVTPDHVDIAPETVLENMRSVFRQYSSVFGGNPVGTNPEITKALDGGNPKQIKFIPPDSGLRINANGELVDAWSTPFFFHQLSAKEMEIHSAGPDRVMWTKDDLVSK